ncbi:MAG: hypothetical protein EBX78_07200, partial [Gammaproteobacteria bacterium]|nr:hypothetical protein [Gammaproteobacteria bacterium]
AALAELQGRLASVELLRRLRRRWLASAARYETEDRNTECPKTDCRHERRGRGRALRRFH